MRASFDDNCFDIAPGIERKVEVTLDKSAKMGDLQKRMQFSYCK